jgi:hypothetical protein
LAEPVRFTAAWERDASLRLRQGDATALDDYDQHGRIHGAPPDEALDQAARAYVASYLAGRDVLLAAADWARCRELSTRIRDDLIHLGLVDATRTMPIADGARAGVGDLIICRHNDHTTQAGEPGRALANGDILRIEAITRGSVMVRRMLGPDPATGQRRFTPQAFRYPGYRTADLAYAVTGHCAQGGTVHTGIALVTGGEDRHWLYPAMTRGTDTNLVFVFTTPATPADHLAILGAIWAAETRDAQHERYRDIVTAALPPEHRQGLSPKATWLFRTLRTAELAGLDPAELTRRAIESRDLAGVRDVAAVLDARIRQRVHPLLPQPQGPWPDRVPHLADRTKRIEQFAASHALPWAITALGPVPTDPAARRDWEEKASAIGAYREMYGYHHPDDPIGPEPSHHSPDQRAAWHHAFTALGPTGRPDVRTMPDGRLWLIRDTYTTETRWAPRHTGRELRLARLGAASAGLNAIREDAEAHAARKDGDHQRAARHERWAASYRAMSQHYRQQETTFAATMANRRAWEQATVHTRHLAIAAAAELRHRHPDQRIEPLQSAEPKPVSDAERDDLTLAVDQKIGQIAGWIEDLAAQRTAFREKLEERRTLRIPSAAPGWEDLGQAFPTPVAPENDAILRPPKPQITPSAKILELAAEPDASPEAAS